jgi:hypothetical protein
MEKAFNFITNLRDIFNNGNIKVKKEILIALGKRFTILDRKLSIEFNEWLVPIKEEYKPLEEDYLRLEPNKNLSHSGISSNLEPICNTWLGRKDSNY